MLIASLYDNDMLNQVSQVPMGREVGPILDRSGSGITTLTNRSSEGEGSLLWYRWKDLHSTLSECYFIQECFVILGEWQGIHWLVKMSAFK